jgi:integrase
VVLGLIDEAQRPDLPVPAAAIFVSATTGLRRGELCGLRWSNVDFKARTLSGGVGNQP